MAELERLRVYIRYEVLLAAELRSVLAGIERAYNRMDSFLSETHRARARNRLRVTSVHTEKSLEAMLSGSGPTIIALAYLIHLLLKERLLYWQTEKTKWDARLAEKKFQQENQEAKQRISVALRKEDRNLTRVRDSLERVEKRIARSSRIVSIEIQLVLDDDNPENERPRRAISLDDS